MPKRSLMFLNTMGQYSLTLKCDGRFSLQRRSSQFQIQWHLGSIYLLNRWLSTFSLECALKSSGRSITGIVTCISSLICSKRIQSFLRKLLELTYRMINTPHQNGEKRFVRPEQLHFLVFHPEMFLFQLGQALSTAGQRHFWQFDIPFSFFATPIAQTKLSVCELSFSTKP